MYTVYSKPNCPNCVKAKKLLELNKLEYKEYELFTGQKDTSKFYFTVEELKKLVPNVQSVPQIFKDDKLIGGFNDLMKHLQ